MREEQLEDNTLGPILRGKEANQKPSTGSACVSRATRRLLQIWDQLMVCNSVLCRQFEAPDGRTAVIQLLVPQKLREEVLADLHEGPMGAWSPGSGQDPGSAARTLLLAGLPR